MTWLLVNARLADGAGPVNLLLRDGRVYLVGAGEADGADLERWDLEGRLVLPGLIEIHAHLDKTYSAIENPDGTLNGAIERFRQLAAKRSLADVERNAVRAIQAALVNGVTKLRSHLNLHGRQDLAVIEVMQGVRRRFRASIDLQFVAMAGYQAPFDHALLKEAVRLGVDVVGGAPALAPAPHATVDAALEAAHRLDLPLDLHIDETEAPSSTTLERLARQKLALGLSLPVTAGHCCSLGFQPLDEARATMEAVAAAGIAVAALPACNLTLMGRGRWPPPRGMAPVAELIEHGVVVAAGSDNVQDPFNPFGNYDPLQSAQLCAMVGQLTSAKALSAALNLVTRNAARAFDGGDAWLVDGAAADLVVLDERDPLAAVASPPPRLATFKGGRLVVRSEVRRQWAAAAAP